MLSHGIEFIPQANPDTCAAQGKHANSTQEGLLSFAGRNRPEN